MTDYDRKTQMIGIAAMVISAAAIVICVIALVRS